DAEIGIDIQRDLLDNLGDGFSFGVFGFDIDPSNFDDVGFEGAIAIGIDDREVASGLISNLNDYLVESGLDLNDRSVEGTDTWWIKFPGIGGIEPSYAVVDDYLVVAATRNSLKQVIQAANSNIDTLGDEKSFTRAVDSAGGGSAIFYVELARLMRMIADSLDGSSLADFQNDVLSWTDPIQTIIWSVDIDDDWTEFKAVVTLAE
ncbi:MAG: DUF3352 domain-containing protein, partial [Chloroflexi bacterium]|nr:DUF3352 domain-containing protein [Chloroflexota bacterium]